MGNSALPSHRRAKVPTRAAVAYAGVKEDLCLVLLKPAFPRRIEIPRRTLNGCSLCGTARGWI